MTQHTPGPWQVSANGNDIEPAGEACLGICAMYATERTGANARLIAAAPELLAALKFVLENCRGFAPDGVTWKPRDIARAAIAKAEGSATT